MGQKVNPIGLRLGVNQTWFSKWFDETNYAKLLHEDLSLRQYLQTIFKKMDILVDNIHIKRSKGKVFLKMVLFHEQTRKKPIIDKIQLEKLLSKWTKKEVELSIEFSSQYTESATLLAKYIAFALEKRTSFKEVFRRCLQKAQSNKNIKGIRMSCSGRLDGAEIARTEWIKDGQVPLHTFQANIDYGIARANTIYGVCGVKVWICFDEK